MGTKEDCLKILKTGPLVAGYYLGPWILMAVLASAPLYFIFKVQSCDENRERAIYSITKDELVERVYKAADKNKDGKISAGELESFLERK